MEHFHRRAGAFTHGDRFLHRVDDFRAFAANVAGVNTAVLRCRFRNFDQLVSLCVARRRIDERRRHAHRATTHRGVHDRLHPRQLSGVGRARRLPEHRFSGLRLAKIAAEVDANTSFLKPCEVVVNARSRNRRAAFTTDRGRHTFLQFVLGASVFRQHASRLIHHVNPTGAHVLPCCVDLFSTVRRNLSDFHEATVSNRNVGKDPRTTLTVEHSAVANHDVVVGVGARR